MLTTAPSGNTTPTSPSGSPELNATRRDCSYGGVFADVYDAWYPASDEDQSTIDLLGELAGGGALLELGVGTGRLASALARRGLTVWGIDSSPAMVEQIADKAGGDHVRIVVGDMSQLDLPPDAPPFEVAFTAFNTFCCLPSDESRAACLGNAAAALTPSGCVVIEAFVPSTPPVFRQGQVEVVRLGVDAVVLKVSKWLEDESVIAGQHIEISEQGIHLRPWRLHPLTLEHLDALAATAGLRCESRYGGWDRAPFGPWSSRHVSIYRKIATT